MWKYGRGGALPGGTVRGCRTVLGGWPVGPCQARTTIGETTCHSQCGSAGLVRGRPRRRNGEAETQPWRCCCQGLSGQDATGGWFQQRCLRGHVSRGAPLEETAFQTSIPHHVPCRTPSLQPAQLISCGFTSPPRTPWAPACLEGHRACHVSASPLPKPLGPADAQRGGDKPSPQRRRAILNKEWPSAGPDLPRVVLAMHLVNFRLSVLGGPWPPKCGGLPWPVGCCGQRHLLPWGPLCCSGLAQWGKGRPLCLPSTPFSTRLALQTFASTLGMWSRHLSSFTSQNSCYAPARKRKHRVS